MTVVDRLKFAELDIHMVLIPGSLPELVVVGAYDRERHSERNCPEMLLENSDYLTHLPVAL